MPGLLANVRRSARYNIGGVVQAIAVPTFLPNGMPVLSVTRASATAPITAIAVAADVVPVILEFEENEGIFSDDVKIGANRYPEPTVGYKFSDHDDAKNAIMQAFDLTKTTHLVRLKSGKIKLVGEKNGVQSTQSKSGAGGKADDFNGYDVVLTGAETARCPDVPESVWLQLLETVAD